jgi:hypothetical protein
MIKKEFKLINSDKTLKEVVLDAEDFLENAPDGGATLTGYFKNNKIKKIVSWIGLSIGNEMTEYYFQNEQLIFVYKKFDSFIVDEKNQELDHTKMKTSFSGRYYFQGNKMINRITTGDKPFGNDSIDSEKELLMEANNYLQKLKKKLSKQ